MSTQLRITIHQHDDVMRICNILIQLNKKFTYCPIPPGWNGFIETTANLEDVLKAIIKLPLGKHEITKIETTETTMIFGGIYHDKDD